MTLKQEASKFDASNLVTLFILDTTELGGEVLRFTASADSGDTVTWDGDEYAPVPIMADGFEISSSGTLPSPTLRVVNSPALQSGVIALDDLLGATFYRIRTFATFLDDGATPDPTAHFPIDTFKIDRKVSHNKLFIEWELSASIDQEGRKIPARQVIRDYCTHIYRTWDADAGEFNYDKATCPYTGTAYFDEANGIAVAVDDRCGKRLSSCKKRFGTNAELPTRAFPGVSRAR